MRRDGNSPVLGLGGLHIRPGIDVQAEDAAEEVSPGDGGLSTAPEDPMLLAVFMRPASLGGTGKRPVWAIARTCLSGYTLRSRRDGDSHELIEPAQTTTLGDFEVTIHSTAREWSIAGE